MTRVSALQRDEGGEPGLAAKTDLVVVLQAVERERRRTKEVNLSFSKERDMGGSDRIAEKRTYYREFQPPAAIISTCQRPMISLSVESVHFRALIGDSGSPSMSAISNWNTIWSSLFFGSV